MATLHASDRRVSGSIPGWFRFGFFEPHSKNHSKGAKTLNSILNILNLECVKAQAWWVAEATTVV